MDPTLKRSIKLTGVAFAIAAALCAVGHFLPEKYRLLMWGAAGGLLGAMLIFLAGAYRRRSMAPSSPAGRPRKTQGWAAIAIAIVVGLAATITRLVAGEATQMAFLGAAFGVVAAIALILSPLFYKPVPPQPR